VADGRVKVLYTSEQGDEMVLATLGVGDTFGELAVLDGSPRSASVITVTPTVVFMITRAALLEAVSSSPELVDAVFAGLGGTVRRLTEQASDLASLDLGGRLAKLLYRLAEERGRARHKAVLDLQLNQSEIASMVGASRPAVNRTLQSLATRGVLSVDGQVIVLHDLPALRRRAGL
jgi:CRP/FNR family cyclic AMP-dependent transcriptional regulator